VIVSAASARVLVALLAVSGAGALEALAMQVRLDGARTELVDTSFAVISVAGRAPRFASCARPPTRARAASRVARGTARRRRWIPSFVAAPSKQGRAMDDETQRAIALFRFGVLGPLVSARSSTAIAPRISRMQARRDYVAPDGRRRRPGPC
jgi:hypothetical protein